MKALASRVWTKPDCAWSANKIDQRRQHAVLIALSTLCVFFLLLSLKTLDDNRLTSWQWTFTDARDWLAGLSMLPMLALAWHASAVRLSRRAAAWMLFLSAMVVGMMFWTEPEVIVDSSRYFPQAKYLAVYGIGEFLIAWGDGLAAWTDLPLVPFVYGLTFKLFGETRLAIQLVTTLFFAGTVILTYLLGRILWNDTVGLYGGALLLGMPYLLTQVPLMLVDVPTMFFLVLAVYMSWTAMARGTLPLLLLAALSIVLALLAKYSTWLMLTVLPLVVVCQWQQGGRSLALRSAIITAAVLLVMAVVLAWKWNVIFEQISLLLRYQLPGLDRWGESHASTFLFQVHPFITLAAVCSVLIAAYERDLRYLIVGWMLILIVLLEIRRIRYTLIAFPMLALMAAYALSRLSDRRTAHFVVLCTVGSGIIIGSLGFCAFLKTTSAVNIKHAGAYLDGRPEKTVEVMVLPQTRSIINPAVSVPILDLFTHKRLVYRHDASLHRPPQRSVLATSPVRFSWLYTPDPYYANAGEPGSKLIAVIASDIDQKLPAPLARRLADYRLAQIFSRSEGVFRYATIVSIYESVSSQTADRQPLTFFRGGSNGS